MDERLFDILKYIKKTIYAKESRPDFDVKICDSAQQSTVTITCHMFFNPLWFPAIRMFLFRRRLRRLYKQLRKEGYGNIARSFLHWDDRWTYSFRFVSRL